jgi:hypothetical protein
MKGEEEQDERLAATTERAEAELADLEQRSEHVGEEIDETRREWETKRNDPGVPGAEPEHEEDAGDEVAGDWEGEGPAADEGGQ